MGAQEETSDGGLKAELVARLESRAHLPAGVLGRLLALEDRFPDLNARGERRALYREVAQILDAAADGLPE